MHYLMYASLTRDSVDDTFLKGDMNNNVLLRDFGARSKEKMRINSI